MNKESRHAAGIQRIFVIGAGQMGSGIVQVAATSGFEVTLMDVAEPQLEKGRAAIQASLNKLREKKRITDEQAASVSCITLTTSLADASGADVVIEAASENVEIKTNVFAELDRIAPAHALLASNTSSISLTRLGAATGRPDKVIGMHFFNPVPVMSLIEVVRGELTSQATVDVIVALSKTLGKTPVVVKDSPGFISNRLLCPMINEAILALEHGVATREGIDAIMTLGMNHPMGPLALADFVGLDVVLAVMEVLHHDFGDDKFAPAPLLRRMVDAGLLGKKSGRGFYTY